MNDRAPRGFLPLVLCCLCSAFLAWPAHALDPDDRDGDGVVDPLDNCVVHPNPSQRDTDGDGIGNRCDADFDNDGDVDADDRSMMVQHFVFEPHGRSDNHVRRTEPPGECNPGGGVWDRADLELARHMDLDSDGDVDSKDLVILNSLEGAPPGPRLDTDGDGAADLDDPCLRTPEGATLLLPGCSALDIVQSPEDLLDPVLASIDEIAGALAGNPATFRGPVRGLGAASSGIRQGAQATRSGDPCGGGGWLDTAVTDLDTARQDLDSVIRALRAELPAFPRAEDVPEQLADLMELELWSDRIGGAGASTREIADAVGEVCRQADPTMRTRGIVDEVMDGARRVRLRDGTLLGLAHGVLQRGELGIGREATFDGLLLETGLGLATEVASEGIVGFQPEALQCVRLQFVPVQRMPPLFSGPFVHHHPEAYEHLGSYLTEHGMGVAAEATCPPPEPQKGGAFQRHSLTVEITYVRRSDGMPISKAVMAQDLVPGDDPVRIPWQADPDEPATLHVTTRVQDCTKTGKPPVTDCEGFEVITSKDYPLALRERGERCALVYAATEFDVNDQVASDFRQTWVEDFVALAVWDPGTDPEFRAEGYPLCPGPGGGFVPCPDVQTIFEDHSFAIKNTDFYPIHPAGLQPVLAGLASGVARAAGLRWPHVRGWNNGHAWQFSCTVPWVVRDVVNFCAGTNAYFRLPFAQGVTSWTQGQGNKSGGTHGQGYAYDMGAPCGTEIRAARAGRVAALTESNSQQRWDDCIDEADCPNHTCCPDDSCDANVLWIKHQDGTYGQYVHSPMNGVVPQVGDLVRRGEHIADVGTTGNSSGPHLHFALKSALVGSGSTTLALFEALHSETNAVMTCYEPHNYPSATSPHRKLRSNNQPWP